MEDKHKCSEHICMCAGRPECHECYEPFYNCSTIDEAIESAIEREATQEK